MSRHQYHYSRNERSYSHPHAHSHLHSRLESRHEKKKITTKNLAATLGMMGLAIGATLLVEGGPWKSRMAAAATVVGMEHLLESGGFFDGDEDRDGHRDRNRGERRDVGERRARTRCDERDRRESRGTVHDYESHERTRRDRDTHEDKRGHRERERERRARREANRRFDEQYEIEEVLV